MPHAGTGQIGIAAAAELLHRSWSVTLGHTGRHLTKNIPAGADLAVIDRRDASADLRQLAEWTYPCDALSSPTKSLLPTLGIGKP
jgi:hypothetical protein